MTNPTEAVELTREWVEILREAFEDQAHLASKSFILSNYPRLAELARFWLAAQSRQDEARGWQPIETAPKGPKIIVAYRNSLGNWRRVMARYYADEQLENDDLDDGMQYAPAGWYEESETHCEHLRQTDCPPIFWHPLPQIDAALSKEPPQ